MSRRAFATSALALLLAGACSPAASTAPRTSSTPASQAPSTPASAGASDEPSSGSADREPGVIKGRVTDEQGDPVPGAELEIVGYTGGSNLGQEIQTQVAGPDGTYRAEVPDGLYEVLGAASIEWNGATYAFELDAADGECDQALSEEGIVEDFVWRLSGLYVCATNPDPDAYHDYHGGAIQLSNGMTAAAAPGAVITFTLTPTEPLPDGSEGEAITRERTVQALSTSAGPIGDTWILEDIPLGVYAVTAELDGRPITLSTESQTSPAAEVEIRFGARPAPLGFTVPTLTVHDAG